MKRLLFSVTGVSMLVALSGCGTPNGPIKGSEGKALTTPTGAQIVVTDTPNNPPPVELDKNATMAERVKARKAYNTRPFQISRQDADVAQEVREIVQKNVCEIFVRLSKSGELKKVFSLLSYTSGRPEISAKVIQEAAGRPISDGTVVALRALIEKDVIEYLKKEVYPRVIDRTIELLKPSVEQSVEKGDYFTAREKIWVVSTRGIPEIDTPVREKALELMHYAVNPRHWTKVEAELNAAFKAAMDTKSFDDGIAKTKKIAKDSLAKEYAALIDKKIAAIKDELVRIGVPEADMKPILEKQSALISAAEKIVDLLDDVMTLEKMKTEKREVEPRKDPALEEYYKRLDDFRATLVKYNCTEENADKITIDLDKDLVALFDLLRKPAVFATDETGAKTALRLGTRSLNTRINALAETNIEKLQAAKSALRIQQMKEKLDAAMSDLEKKVRELVAEGKYEEARELIWNAAATGDPDWDSVIFVKGLDLLRKIVNPADWARIEKDIKDTFNELAEEGKFDEATKFLNEYPLIRQHTIKLEEQLAKVKAEAESLGAKEEDAAHAAQIACAMVTEAAALVDHIDEIVSSASQEGKKLDRSRLEKELAEYAKKLAAYHATPENVTKIVEQLRAALDKLIAEPQNPKTTRLSLGTNAVNDRILNLRKALLASIPKVKREWEDRTCEKLKSDLPERVRAAVKEQRFEDARNIVRDEKLIGRKDLDLQLYVLRVGLLDSVVNPAQLDYLLAEIDKKVAEFKKNRDFEGFRKYVDEYPYVHDEYARIDTALAAVKKEMLALEISESESDKDTKRRFAESIRKILENRLESWKPERNLTELEKALKEVSAAIFDHLNKHEDVISQEYAEEYKHILADIAALDRTLTTWELNERLRARLVLEEDAIKAGLAELAAEAAWKAYLEKLAEIDADVSFDAQIAMAEESISRQLSVKCDTATFKINALMGEYARMFRLLKKQAKLDDKQATTILIGAAYLDQAQVVKYALELGAKIDGVSDRDPRGRTALAMAIDAGHSALVKPLIEAGASLDATDKDQNAIVHYAAKSGNLSVLKAITSKASVNVQNANGDTPLSVAVVRNQSAIVEFLTAAVEENARKAFVNKANKQGYTAFDIAARVGSRDVLDALAAAGAEYGTKDLVLAEKADHVAIAQWLINQGLDVNAAGVMDDACPATRTGRYLISEGGLVSKHACVLCDDELKKEALQNLVVGPKKSVSTKECEANCQPQPIDVLLVPSAK